MVSATAAEVVNSAINKPVSRDANLDLSLKCIGIGTVCVLWL